jgi:transcription elongation factor
MPFNVSRNPRKRKRQPERLAPVLFDPVIIKDVHGPGALKQQGNTYIFDNKTFLNGMLILNLQSLHTLDPIPFPSLKEVMPFVDAGFISHDTALEMTKHEELPRLRPGDSVVILHGKQAGLQALVVTIEDYLACLDIDPVYINPGETSRFVDVPVYVLRRILRIGDYVRVREDSLTLAGRSGDIVAISPDETSVTFIDDKTRDSVRSHPLKLRQITDPQQITMHVVYLETYAPDLVLADVPLQVSLTPKNSLVGRRILVCGKTIFKGYAGYVRSIAARTANVSLDANGRIEQFPLRDIVDL